jgi:hypothetical protein
MLELGDLAAVDQSIEAVAQVADALGEPRARAYVPLVRAIRALLDGRIEQAERLNMNAAELASEVTQDAIVPMIIAAQLFWIRWTQARVSELEPAVRHMAETYPLIPSWRCALTACLREAGQEQELKRELDRLGTTAFSALPRDNAWLVGLALLAEACATVSAAEHAKAIEEMLAPFAGRQLVSPIAACIGPVNRYLGLLAGAQGENERALQLLAKAGEEAGMLGARPMLTMIALDEARVHAANGDVAAGANRAHEAAAVAGELGLDALSARAAALAEELSQADAATTATATTATTATTAGTTAETATADVGGGTLRRDGDVWNLRWAGRTMLLRDSKGLRYLARLLADPGVEMHSVDLVGPPPARARSTARAVLGDELHARASAEQGMPVLDDRAKREYRRRLTELRDELAQAEDWGDPERAVAAREEMETVAHELAAAVGLGGRDRQLGSTAERARVNATRAIRTAISRITEADEDLGHHLATTVKTGAFCCYQPRPGSPPWDVG